MAAGVGVEGGGSRGRSGSRWQWRKEGEGKRNVDHQDCKTRPVCREGRTRRESSKVCGRY